jgi:hypothetical protein
MRQPLCDIDLDTNIVGVDAEDSSGANRGEHVAEDSPRGGIRRTRMLRSKPGDSRRYSAYVAASDGEIGFTPEQRERHRREVRFGIPLYKSTT